MFETDLILRHGCDGAGYFDQHADAAAFKTFVEVAVEDDYTEYFYVWNKKIMKKEVRDTSSLPLTASSRLHFSSMNRCIASVLRDSEHALVQNIERTPTLMIYRHFDSPETEYTGSWDKAGIEEAIRVHKVGLLAVLRLFVAGSGSLTGSVVRDVAEANRDRSERGHKRRNLQQHSAEGLTTLAP